MHYVTNLYEIFLARTPEPSGLAFWMEKMGSPGTPGANTGGAEEKSILAAFLGSDEFFLKSGGTTPNWLTAVYKDLFGRAPDNVGLRLWSQAVSLTGDHDGIARDILSAPEAAHDVLDSFYPAVGGPAGFPLGAPGTRAGAGLSELALLTGGGWENVYLEGPAGNLPQGNDGFFALLIGDSDWDDVQLQILGSEQFYTNANRPLTA
jgi:hypothetical protein